MGFIFFENTGKEDSETDLPIFKPAQRLGKAVDNVSISYVDNSALITTPGRIYPDFLKTALETSVNLPAEDGFLYRKKF